MIFDGTIMALDCPNLKTLGKLRIVNGALNLVHTPITSLGDLEEVNGNCWIDCSNLSSLQKLEHVNGSLLLKNVINLSLGKLSHVRDDIRIESLLKNQITRDTLKDLGKLKNFRYTIYINREGYFIHNLLREGLKFK